MINWKTIALFKYQTVKEAMEVLSKTALRVVFIVDDNMHLEGVVTDGDIRRGLLRGVEMLSPVSFVTNTTPLTASVEMSRENIRNLMSCHKLLAMPIVDQNNHVMGLETIDTLSEPVNSACDVILMAGGFGKRLLPLTEHVPKPMLRVGNKPILESIIQSCIEQGFRNFYISTCYKSEVISDFFQDGSAHGCNIQYLKESVPLGTAGGLSLIPKKISDDFIVMNADIITKINLNNLLNYHTSHQALATMCVRQIEYHMPYGVVEIEYPALIEIKEKPSYKHCINAGIYTFSKKIKSEILPNEYLDMPTLYKNLIKAKKNVVAFPLYEYWIDIGRHEDYQKILENEYL